MRRHAVAGGLAFLGGALIFAGWPSTQMGAVGGPAPRLALYPVPISITSYRLLSMSMDDEGFIWAGSIHRVIHRYDPRKGTVRNIPLPYDSSAASCICAGKKVYVLGQSYPRLIIFDRASKKFRETAYPSAKPNVWYGTGAVDGRHIYLFDRGSAGVIKWDTHTDVGTAIPYPYKTAPPGGGLYEARDKALWCRVTNLTDDLYAPIGLARLDVTKDRFTDYYAFPREDTGLKPYTDPGSTFFLGYTLKGKVVPFDFKEKRFCKFLDVPGFRKRFAFLGGPWVHKDRYYFSLSTYDGKDGFDGRPHHFCNAILQFDPRSGTFAFLTLDTKGAYYQIAYMLSAGNEFFATATNIREPDGRLSMERKGEVLFWQTIKPGRK